MQRTPARHRLRTPDPYLHGNVPRPLKANRNQWFIPGEHLPPFGLGQVRVGSAVMLVRAKPCRSCTMCRSQAVGM